MYKQNNNMKNVHIKMEDDLHLQVRKFQLEKELSGEKITLMEAFEKLIKLGLEKANEK